MKRFVFSFFSAIVLVSTTAFTSPALDTVNSHVLQQPQSATFLVKNNYLPLQLNDQVNPAFVKLLKEEIRQDALLKNSDLSQIQIAVKIGVQGEFVGTILGFTDSDSDVQAKAKLQAIVANKIKYKPAVMQQQAVRFELITLVNLGN